MTALSRIRTAPLKAFKSEEKAMKCGMWVAGLFGNSEARAFCKKAGLLYDKSLTEGIMSAGGVLVPHDFLPEMIALREAYGVFRRAAQVVPMSSDLTSVPRLTAGIEAYFVGEGVAPTESTASTDSIHLSASKLSALSRASSEIYEDSAIDLGDWFLTELAIAFARKEDQCGFLGNGSPDYGRIQGVCPGLLVSGMAGAVVAASGHDTFAELDISDLVSLIAKLPSYALPDARWFISNIGFALAFCRVAAGAGGLVVQSFNGRNVLTFMGFPVEISPVLSQSTGDLSGQIMLLFGDLRLAATLGDRREVSVAVSTEWKFAEDQVGFRGSERFDINVHDIGDETTPGPIVALVGE